MANFSKQSKQKLQELHTDLQAVLLESIKVINFTIICGYRGEDEQEKAFREGKSKAHFGQSKHNFNPSMAVDLAPYPTNWNDIGRFKKLANVILKTANQHGVKIIWGGNFLSFKDYPHFELKGV